MPPMPKSTRSRSISAISSTKSSLGIQKQGNLARSVSNHPSLLLARYSAEFTVFRELIQNANDAGASEVLVEFLTDRRGDSLAHSICIQNNGRPFTDTDWLRLRRIAEGNPDEQKVKAAPCKRIPLIAGCFVL
jgi:hypothetical protein